MLIIEITYSCHYELYYHISHIGRYHIKEHNLKHNMMFRITHYGDNDTNEIIIMP